MDSPARCRHFGTCGGCSRQDLPYPEQLRLKTERVRAALSPLSAAPALALRPSPDIWYYRNKMEFSVADVYPPPPPGERLFHLGLKPKGRWHQVLDLAECFLLSPETPALLEAVRVWAHQNGVLPYNKHKKTGVLRNLVVREAKNTPERLVLLVTTSAEVPSASFINAVHSVYPATTILRGVTDKLADTAVADALEVWAGPGHITEVLRLDARALRFKISPQSFFQTNTRGAEVLYGILRRWAAELRPAQALDLYCGAGTIALSLADLCGEIVGAEISPGAIADAKQNAVENGVFNAAFVAAPVERLLGELLQKEPDLAIVDPPRSGLHPSALAALVERPPKNLFYVSCNPEALGRDLSALDGIYSVEAAEVVDLFPHTDHVETAARLSRRG